MSYPTLAERSERLEARGLERTAYSTLEVADMLGVCQEHVHRMVRAGLIPHKRLGRRIIIPAGLFHQWLNSPDDWTSADVELWRGN
jgi:excisionase family DNA binding protein